MSSSEDENFQSNIKLPNLQQYQKKPSTNLVRAGKKFKIRNKHINSPRHSFVSAGSSANVSEESDDESIKEADPNLTNFVFKNPEAQQNVDITDDDMYPEDSDMVEGDLPENLEASDSDESRVQSPTDTHALGKHTSIGSKASRASHGSRTSHESHTSHATHTSQTSQTSPGTGIRNMFRRASILSSSSRTRSNRETDITDQLRTTNSGTSNSTGRSNTIFKDILRKVSLQDEAYSERPNHGDTFIGQILDGDSTQGLSGGGLVPGGTRYSHERFKPIDEEEEIDSDRNSIELQRLDFAQLNNEARNLINGHVPERYRQETFDLPGIISHPTGSSSDTIVKENSKEHNREKNEAPDGGRRGSNESKESDLYAPNPDLFLRSDVAYNDEGEFMMLDDDSGLIAPPAKVHAGVLSSLLKLYQNPDESKSSSSLNYDHFDEESRVTSRTTTDLSRIKGGLKHVKESIPFMKKTQSAINIPILNEDGIEEPATGPDGLPSFHNAKPKLHKKTTVAPGQVPSKVSKQLKKAKRKQAEQLRITVHIADVLQRQKFIMLMCKALMLFGAPTHRLEEYMIMTSRVLEIDGQFIYLPGCMIMAFGDAATRTSEVHLVKCSQGVNLSKLSEAHRVYKGVIHDLMGVEEASIKLTKLLKSRNQYNPWWCVLLYGLGSAMVCPFAFGGGWVDLPICFGVGLCVGYLQFFVSSMSNLYSSVFEVTASIVVSFIARAIGSINGGNTFCFSAIAQGSLALILPGYIILCGSLELQSRNLVAGSVRMFYAIIYSLFLGFGITLGASLYGWIDKHSVSNVTCPAGHSVDPKFRILFVPAFTACLGLINQAKFRQLPVMIIIASVGYIGTYFSGLHFKNVTEFTACIGAFIVGILGNLYSRIWKGLAVSAMLPAIFVQVPSGIASQSSLLSGINTANEITAGNTTTTTSTSSDGSLSFGSAMVEVSVGISVGLFAAALIVYPFGKKKTGLFSL